MFTSFLNWSEPLKRLKILLKFRDVCKMFAIKTKNHLIIKWLSWFLWSWRDSNPRPNKQYASFLHAYFAIGFRRKADSKQPTLRLSSKIFVPEPKTFGTYFCIFCASKSNVAEQNFRETSCFLTILREKRQSY